jgi:hypothetical protein
MELDRATMDDVRAQVVAELRAEVVASVGTDVVLDVVAYYR